MSWKVEVQVGGRDEWCNNAMRYTTKPLAEREGQSLMMRWLLVTDMRVVESDDEPNYGVDANGMLKPVAEIIGVPQLAADVEGEGNAPD